MCFPCFIYFLQDPTLCVQTMLDDFHVAEQRKPGHVFSLFLVRRAEQKQFSHFCKALCSEGKAKKASFCFTSKKLNWVVVSTHMFQRVETTNFRKEDVQNINEPEVTPPKTNSK